MVIINSLNEIYKIHEEAMDIGDLPIDELVKSNSNMPYTVMNVALNARSEQLIEKALKCMNILIADNQKNDNSLNSFKTSLARMTFSCIVKPRVRRVALLYKKTAARERLPEIVMRR